jgi:hypothetical protein
MAAPIRHTHPLRTAIRTSMLTGRADMAVLSGPYLLISMQTGRAV